MNCTFEDKRKTFLDYRYTGKHTCLQINFLGNFKVKGF